MNNPEFSNFGESVAYHRILSRLTQRQLGRKIGRSRGRVSDLELNRRPPTQDEVIQLAYALKVSPDKLGNAIPRKPRPKSRVAKTFFHRQRLQKFVKERPNFTRFREAKRECPQLYAELLRAARKQQHTKRLVSRYLHEIVVESDNEAMWELHKLGGGPYPVSVSPQGIGLRFIPIITPDLRRFLIGDLRYPALEFRTPYHCLLFPQITLGTKPKPCRPDNLAAIKVGTKTEFFLVEINGELHRDRRENPLPVIALDLEDLRSRDCLQRFWTKVAELLQTLPPQ